MEEMLTTVSTISNCISILKSVIHVFARLLFSCMALGRSIPVILMNLVRTVMKEFPKLLLKMQRKMVKYIQSEKQQFEEINGNVPSSVIKF